MSLYRDALERCRRRLLRWALRKSHGHVVNAAKLLGLDRSATHYMLKNHGVDPMEFRRKK